MEKDNIMKTITINKDELNELVKENLAKILKNRDDLFEILEDITFGKMIEQGDKNDFIPEDMIFEILSNNNEN